MSSGRRYGTSCDIQLLPFDSPTSGGTRDDVTEMDIAGATGETPGQLYPTQINADHMTNSRQQASSDDNNDQCVTSSDRRRHNSPRDVADHVAGLFARHCRPWTSKRDQDPTSTIAVPSTGAALCRPPRSPRPLGSAAGCQQAETSTRATYGNQLTSCSSASSLTSSPMCFTYGFETSADEQTTPQSPHHQQSPPSPPVAANDRVPVADGRGSASPDSGRPSSRGRSRFKKILRPLRRTRSAGCSEDVSAGARLFSKSGRPTVKSTSLTPPGTSRLSDADGTFGSSDSDIEDTSSTFSSSSSVKDNKSVGREMRLRFPFLRRHSDSSPDETVSTPSAQTAAATAAGKSSASKSSLPSLDCLQRWGESMDQLLADEYGRFLFGEFLRGEFSEENLEFWLACELYRTSASADSLPDLAQTIYTDFVAAQAPREINLDSGTRQQTAVNVQHPDRSTFRSAQKRIQALMERDSYRRFLESDIFRRHLAACQRTSAGKGPLSAIRHRLASNNEQQ